MMTDKNTFKKINETLDFLLEDHEVDFDDSQMDSESLDTFHKKANALLNAHQIEIPETIHDVAGLQPKLDLLIEGHGANFDDSELEPDSFDTVLQKLDVLTQEHGA